VGIDWSLAQNKFMHGAIGGCAKGFRIREASQNNFYGVVFSGGGVQLEVIGSAREQNFRSCWFEGSTTSIVKKGDTITHDIGDFLFSGCRLLTASTTSLMDFDYMRLNISIKGGRLDPGSASFLISMPVSGTRISIEGVENAGSFTFSGIYTGLRATPLPMWRSYPWRDGNAGTTYAPFDASDMRLEAQPDQVVKAEIIYLWEPRTTAGGIRAYNMDTLERFGASEPGAAPARWDIIDVTAAIRGMTQNQRLLLETKGDGVTAPAIGVVWLRIWT